MINALDVYRCFVPHSVHGNKGEFLAMINAKYSLAFAAIFVCTSTYGQGRVAFGNDSDHYFVLGGTLPADIALGGGSAGTEGNSIYGAVGAIPESPLPSGVTLAAALYAGTMPGGETLQTALALEGSQYLTAGRMSTRGIILNGVLGGQPAYFQIYVYDGSYATPFMARDAGSYFGTTGEFTAIPSSSLTCPNLVCGSPANSTWAPGNLVINAAPNFVPEPSVIAFAGLGLLIILRAKMSAKSTRNQS